MKSRLLSFLSRFSFKRPDNLRLVLLSITTAAVFWLFNALNKEYDASVDYPVTWGFNNQQYIVVDELPGSIRINVKGLGWTLLRAYFGLRVKPINIDLSNPMASRKITGVSLTNRVDDNLEDLRLNYILEDTLYLHIDKRTTRSFAVYIDSANISLAENYRIISPIDFDTHLLEVEGPNTLLYQNPSDSFLIAVPEGNINSNYDDEIEFAMDRAELFRFNPQHVRVSFEVAEFTNTERQIVLDQIGFPNDSSVTLTDTVCTVHFIVRADQEELISVDSFIVSADFANANLSDTTLMLRLERYPAELLDVRIALPQVRLVYNE